MKTYLKIFLGIIFITIFCGIPAQAQDQTATTPASVAPTASATPASATPPAAVTPTAPAPTASAVNSVAPASTYYNYANDEAEYSVMLPEAPTVRTLLAESTDTTPYLTNPPTDSPAIGEVATFSRADIDTEEMFSAKITFIKAKHSFLEGLTEEKIKELLIDRYKNAPLENAKFAYTVGNTGALKWGILSGFTLDANHHPAFSAIHYLTGQQSILVVQVTYSIENKTFQDYYDHLVSGITYNAL